MMIIRKKVFRWFGEVSFSENRSAQALRAIMGVMDAPKDVWVSRLGLALKVESVVFMTFWFLAYTVKCKSSAISTCGPIHNLLLACVQLA